MTNTWKCAEHESAPEPSTKVTAPTAGAFEFEGVAIEVSRSVAGWHLYSAGHTVTNSHLGTATRILFDPEFHTSTSGLVQEILAWAAANPRHTDRDD